MLTGRIKTIGKIPLDASLFRKAYIILISCEMLAFVYVVALILKSLVLIWGSFILVHNFFIEGLAFKIKHKYLLWSFLILMIITSIVHMSIWFVPNLVITYYTAVCFFIFYGMYMQQDLESIEKEMIFILKFFVNFGLIFGSLSLLILFSRQKIELFGYYLGIFRNRLIGVYTNSNILAFSMIEAIVACDILSDSYIIKKFKIQKVNKLKLGICALVSCVCLFLSDSNASFVFLMIYATIRVFCNLFFKHYFQYPVKFFKSILITFGFCLVIMSMSFALRDACQNFMSIVLTDVYKHEDIMEHKLESFSAPVSIIEKNVTIPKEESSGGEEKGYLADFHVGRQHYEVSSGRITLFKQGVEIFKHNPWIGIGRANLGIYARKYLKGGLIHPDLHNGYLTILVSCGIIGFLIFAIFSFLVTLEICKHLLICVEYDYFGVFCKLFSVLVAYCGYCLFEKAILFDMTFMVGFFWSMLGYAMTYVFHMNENKN